MLETEAGTTIDGADPVETVSEISYDEQRYPARPRRLRPRDQFRAVRCGAS